MKVGDLICYNAAGMRGKTLGVVLDASTIWEDNWTRTGIKLEQKKTEVVLIMWFMMGKYMPRLLNHPGINDSEPCRPGWMHASDVSINAPVWYKKGSWFEVRNESR